MKNRILITFYTTTQAMAMEDCCRSEGVKGRLIPVPGKISAGCGVGWMTDREEKARLLAFAERKGLSFQEVYDLDGIFMR